MDKGNEVRLIFENFENGLVKAGVNIGNINYDVLCRIRLKAWNEVEELLRASSETE